MGVAFGFVAFFAVLAYSGAQLFAGFVGIEDGLGMLWAWVALVAALIFRFTLPITVGSFFGAMNVWGWHWAAAALFAAPGLLLIVPGVLAYVLSLAKR